MKNVLVVLTFLAGVAIPSWGDVLLTTNPVDGHVFGTPGELVGFGFTLNSDPNTWTTVIGSFVLTESNPSLGVYVDLIGSQGGPIDGLLPPDEPTWTEAFGLGTGLGFYAIDPGALLGAETVGTIRVLYEQFLRDPRTCGECQFNSSWVDAPFSVTVGDAEAPEPGTMLLVGAAFLALWLRLRLLAKRYRDGSDDLNRRAIQ